MDTLELQLPRRSQSVSQSASQPASQSVTSRRVVVGQYHTASRLRRAVGKVI
ncbi:hypothetical protein ACMBCN_02855 [Candidatus Liberibacter asiaticus]